MSFLKSRPNKVFFFCEREPATGGQTPIADCAAVYRDMDPVVREKFEKKGVRYVRNYVSQSLSLCSVPRRRTLCVVLEGWLRPGAG